MGLTLVVMVALLSAAVIMYCRKRFSDSKGEATGNAQRPSSDGKISACCLLCCSESSAEAARASLSQVSFLPHLTASSPEVSLNTCSQVYENIRPHKRRRSAVESSSPDTHAEQPSGADGHSSTSPHTVRGGSRVMSSFFT